MLPGCIFGEYIPVKKRIQHLFFASCLHHFASVKSALTTNSTIQRGVGRCLTVKNQWELLTGDDSQTKKGYENYDLSMTQEVCGNVDYKTLFQHHHHQLPHINMLINFPQNQKSYCQNLASFFFFFLSQNVSFFFLILSSFISLSIFSGRVISSP